MTEHIDLRHGAWVTYQRGFLDPELADAFYRALFEGIAWEERAILVFGKEVMQPRLVSWAGDIAYKYSGQVLEPREPTPELRALWDLVNAATDCPFNHVVLNCYRDERDNVSLHADNEPELGKDPLIASISLGAERRFLLQPKRKRTYKKQIRLHHGSLLVMGGTTQHQWRHSVPRESSAREPRVNVTFRRLLGPPGWRPPR